MDKQEIEKYLRMLGEELQKRQVTGEILLAGGAVMLLTIQNREVTKDIQEALALVKMYVPEQLLVPRIQYIIEEIFE